MSQPFVCENFSMSLYRFRYPRTTIERHARDRRQYKLRSYLWKPNAIHACDATSPAELDRHQNIIDSSYSHTTDLLQH